MNRNIKAADSITPRQSSSVISSSVNNATKTFDSARKSSEVADNIVKEGKADVKRRAEKLEQTRAQLSKELVGKIAEREAQHAVYYCNT